MIAAIVLAGGQKNLTANGNGPEKQNEALIKIGSRNMVEYVVEAIRQSEFVRDIIIAGDKKSLEKIFADYKGIFIVEAGVNVIESFKNALKFVDKGKQRILIATADIPLIHREAVDSFLKNCFKLEGELFYPIISKETNEQKYPSSKRTYAELKEGSFTGGNLFVLDARKIDRALPVAERLVQYRKKPIKLASCVGWRILLKYILGRLALKEAEQSVSKLMGLKGRAVICTFPEIGLDVDKDSDLELAKKILC